MDITFKDWLVRTEAIGQAPAAGGAAMPGQQNLKTKIQSAVQKAGSGPGKTEDAIKKVIDDETAQKANNPQADIKDLVQLGKAQDALQGDKKQPGAMMGKKMKKK